jgi:hypothetical protein
VPHARLECLSDLVEQQAPPRLLGGNGLDPAVADEHPQPLIASHRFDHPSRVKVGRHPHSSSIAGQPGNTGSSPITHVAHRSGHSIL